MNQYTFRKSYRKHKVLSALKEQNTIHKIIGIQWKKVPLKFF